MFLDFFDEVIVINLVERIDRRVQIEEELQKYSVPYTLFEATKDDNGVRGLVKTMRRLLTQIVSKGQCNTIVLEDDATFLLNPVAFLRHILPQIPKDYQLFYLGLNFLTRPMRISENILKVQSCYSTHAICYSYEGAKFALERLMELPEDGINPYDIFIRDQILPCGRSYATFPMLATQRLSYSNIEKNTVDWGAMMARSFATHTKNFIETEEIWKCRDGHTINGVMPAAVDETKFEIQRPDLVGKVCDCGRFVYTEDQCPVCSGIKWKIIWKNKEEYASSKV